MKNGKWLLQFEKDSGRGREPDLSLSQIELGDVADEETAVRKAREILAGLPKAYDGTPVYHGQIYNPAVVYSIKI